MIRTSTRFLFISLISILLFSSQVFSGNAKWTGHVDSDWNDPANWDSGSLPGSNDHITIDSTGNYTGAKAHPVISSNSLFTPKMILLKNGGKLYIQANLTIKDNCKIDNARSSSIETILYISAGSFNIINDKKIEIKDGGQLIQTGGSIYVTEDVSIKHGYYYIDDSDALSILVVNANLTGNLTHKGNLDLECTHHGGSVFQMAGGTVILIAGEAPQELCINGNSKGGVSHALLDISGGTFTNYGHTAFKNASGDSSVIRITGGTVAFYNDIGKGSSKGGGEIDMYMDGGTMIIAGDVDMENQDLLEHHSGNIRFQNTGTWTNEGSFISSSDTIFFAGNTTLLGSGGNWQFKNVVIDDGNTLHQSEPTNINISGDWHNNNGTFSHGTNKVTFNGDIDQTVACNNTESFYDLELDKTGGEVILESGTEIDIDNHLTLNNGILNTRTNNAIVNFGSGSTSDEGNSGSYIIGRVSKSGTSAFVFPIGDTNIWARLAITAPAVNTTFEAAYYYDNADDAGYDAGSLMNGVNNVSLNEYWILDRTAGSDGVQVTLYWEDAERSGISNMSDLLVARFDGTSLQWCNHGQGSTTGGIGTGVSGSITSSGIITNFSPFTFGSGSSGTNPLPIDLLSFEAKAMQNHVALNWKTATEINNDYFMLERSVNGVDYEILETVKGAGNSNEVQHYQFIDYRPVSGIAYYRLKQIDFDGTLSVFDPIAVEYITSKNIDLLLYPNPNTQSEFTARFSGIKMRSDVEVLIFNSIGQQLHQENFIADGYGNSEITIQQDLLPGMYWITAIVDGQKITAKLLKK